MFDMIEMWNEPSHIKYTRILEVTKQIINTPLIKLDSSSTFSHVNHCSHNVKGVKDMFLWWCGVTI